MSAPPLDHLRTFVTVHRTGSLTRAAALLGISQPTVSAHVRALESSLGFALFTREPSGMTPTAKGTELAREIAPHVDAIEDASSLAGLRTAAAGAVHIGGAAEMLSVMVVPAAHEIAEASGAPVRFSFGLADDLLDALAARSLDVVVSSVQPRLRGIASAPVYDEEFVLVGAPKWAGAAVDGIPVVAYAEHLPIVRRYWRSVFDRRPVGLDVVAVIPDLRGIRSALLAGAGMSVLPRYLVDGDLASGTLVALDRPAVAPLNTIYLATRGREAERDPRIRAVVATLRRLVR